MQLRVGGDGVPLLERRPGGSRADARSRRPRAPPLVAADSFAGDQALPARFTIGDPETVASLDAATSRRFDAGRQTAVGSRDPLTNE